MHSGGLDEPVYQLAHAGGIAIDPVELGKGAAGGVMIDVDEEKRLQAAQPGAIQAVALQQNRGVIGAVNAHDAADGISAGQGAVSEGNAIGGDQVGALAHGSSNMPIASRSPRRRRRDASGSRPEALAVAEHVENGGDGVFRHQPGVAEGVSGSSCGSRGALEFVRAGLGSIAPIRAIPVPFWRLRERSISSSMRA